MISDSVMCGLNVDFALSNEHYEFLQQLLIPTCMCLIFYNLLVFAYRFYRNNTNHHMTLDSPSTVIALAKLVQMDIKVVWVYYS